MPGCANWYGRVARATGKDLLKFLKRSTPAAPPHAAAPAEEREVEPKYGKLDMKLVKRMGKALYPYRWQYLLGLGLVIPQNLLEMQGPRFMRLLINYTTDRTTNPDPQISHVAWLIISWAIVLFTAVIFQRFAILICTRAGEIVQFATRRALFAHLQRMSMSYYDKTKLGRIISRCTSDINAMREVNVWGITKIVVLTMNLVFAASMLAITNWRLFLAVAWLGPVLFLLNREYLKISGTMWQQVREGFTRVSTNLAENITGMRVVTAFDRQEPNLGVFNRLQEDNTTNNMTAARINGVYQPSLELIRFIGRVIVLSYGAYLFAVGQIVGGVGEVVQSFMYWDWFMNPIVEFGNFYNQLMQAMAGAERVFNLLDTQPDVQDAPNAQPLPPIKGHIKFEDVTFGYNPDRPVLHGINFEVQPGQTVALVGATGSGKSSIVSLISRFYQPQKGRVLIDGHDVRHVTGDSLHRQTGLVLQVNYLFTGTVMENIRYAKPDANEEDVIRAATELGSHESIEMLQNGYHTEVGERGANMSLGQRQLICFTRAYLANPKIFMLDEATSAVDTATEMLVQTSLEKLLKGRTTVIVAHRLSTIMSADMILVIEAGKIMERGNHRDLVAAGGKYANLYHQFAMHRE